LVLLALAEAFPAERYGWRTAETAHSVSEVLVHLAAGSRMFLAILGSDAGQDLYGKLDDESDARSMAMVSRNESLEKHYGQGCCPRLAERIAGGGADSICGTI
jgi:uncharacterized damage-inducible protein DinB